MDHLITWTLILLGILLHWRTHLSCLCNFGIWRNTFQSYYSDTKTRFHTFLDNAKGINIAFSLSYFFAFKQFFYSYVMAVSKIWNWSIHSIHPYWARGTKREACFTCWRQRRLLEGMCITIAGAVYTSFISKSAGNLGGVCGFVFLWKSGGWVELIG